MKKIDVSSMYTRKIVMIILIIISLYQEDNKCGMNASLTYGLQLQR